MTKSKPRRHFAGTEEESSPHDPKLRSLTKTVHSAIATYIADEKPEAEDQPSTEPDFTTPPLRLDNTFVSEPPDLDWSEQAESTIEDLLMVTNVDTTVVETRCKTTLCRIKLNLEDVSAEDAATALSRLPWSGESYIHFSRQGEAVFYVVRDGFNIPD